MSTDRWKNSDASPWAPYVLIFSGVVAALQIGKLPPALPSLSLALNLTLTQAGFLLSFIQLAGMTLALAIGLSADGFGLKRSMCFGLVLLGIASAMGAMSDSATGLMFWRVVEGFGYSHINGALFDLGVSSIQLDESERGFSYSQDAPLDMRMDRSRGITASEILNTYEPGKLVQILRTYGEEKFATRIVENIVKARAKAPLNSTTELATLVKESIPAATRRTGGNPAKRTFQALRIEANDELGAITRALPDALDLLMVGGRLVVMSFQSLEDRIVKEIFAEASTSKSPRNLPVELPEYAAKFSLVFRSSETPTAQELESNPRSASVRLRAIERVAA